MDQKEQKSLKYLETLKNAALAHSNQEFPEKFHSYAYFFLTDSTFQSIIEGIDLEWRQDYAEYTQMIISILRLIDYISVNIINHFPENQTLIKLLSGPQGGDIVEIYKKLWLVKKIFNELSATNQHQGFINENDPHVKLLDKKINDLGEESERLRKLEKKRPWGYLRRIRGIVVIYDSREYKTLRNQLDKSAQAAFLQSLEIRYQGLSKSMYDPNTYSYNENFGIQDDKEAIKEIFIIVEQELKNKSNNNEIQYPATRVNHKRLKFSKEKTGILATWGEKNCFIGPRSEEVKNNKRKEFASLFVDKSKVSERDAFDAISDSVPSSGFLSVDELGSVKCTQNDLNKYLKNELGVTTAIRSKSIDKAQRKTIFFINPNY